jgi:hypothetical protein
MKKVILIGMLLGLLTAVSVAQRGRAGGSMSPTARPDSSLGARSTAGVSPTMGNGQTTVNRNVSPTPAPIKDPTIGTTATGAPNGTTLNQSVSPTPAPIRDPLVGASPTAGPNKTGDRNVSPTAASPIQPQ